MRKKKRITTLIIPIFIIFLMISGAIAFSFFGQQPSQYTYNNVEFEPAGNAWSAKINGRYHNFFFHPTQLLDINSGIGTLTYLDYVVTTGDANPDDEASVKQLATEFAQAIPILTNENTGEYSEDAKCEDATSSIAVVIFELGNETRLSQEGNCIRAKADIGYNLLRTREFLIYRILGII